MRAIAVAVLAVAAAVAAAGPFIAPYPDGQQFQDRVFAPPMPLRVVDDAGHWQTPFAYRIRLLDRLERRYEEDRSRHVELAWFTGGRLVAPKQESDGPLLLLGADGLGRDILSRLVHGARISLMIAVCAALGALAIGSLVGAAAGFLGGILDESLMRFSDFVIVLPATYVILALRAAMPLVLPTMAVFLLMVGIFALIGWPHIARGVRAIVSAERNSEYTTAAASIGAGRARVLFRHVLPAAGGFLTVQGTLLLPAFIIGEATLSYVGLGFAEPTATWGTMLNQAADVRAMVEYPWLLAPAAAIVAVVLAVNIVAARRDVTRLTA